MCEETGTAGGGSSPAYQQCICSDGCHGIHACWKSCLVPAALLTALGLGLSPGSVVVLAPLQELLAAARGHNVLDPDVQPLLDHAVADLRTEQAASDGQTDSA
jgi:hypothetical protein